MPDDTMTDDRRPARLEPTPAHPVFRWQDRVNTYVSNSLLGGPRVVKLAWAINLQKGGTGLFVLGLMIAFNNFSAPAWTYLVLHGSYGLIWLLKHVAMPDPKWEVRVTIGGAVGAWATVLGPYWVAPVLLISDVLGPDRLQPGVEAMAGATALYILGVVIMMVADAQKLFTLRHRRGLITDGMFRYIRHPNYLGEMMLYASFAWLSMHWIPWLILAWVWLQLFLPNMMMKEQSMSRYPEWSAYKRRTGLLLPYLG